ncbi:Transcriptional regulator, contains XRE-family HTH domain [Cellulosimicrobium cellulans]|nr:Transcriptional regulator, contains XRE-family HTH domain [Cellulosimicrobium cellulans]
MTTQTEGAGFIPQFTLGDRLRKARQHTGLEQVEFAEEIGISRGTILNYELDRTRPRLIVLKAWALRTGVPLEWLQTGESPRQGDPDGGEALPRLDLNQRPSD